jgi:hypothetical protein
MEVVKAWLSETLAGSHDAEDDPGSGVLPSGVGSRISTA